MSANRDLVQRTEDGQAQVGYSVETRSASFLVEPQNQGLRVSQFVPQNWQLLFGDFGLKITASISWFGPQNHVGFGLSVAPQNQ
jgi:hypothetical protein